MAIAKNIKNIANAIKKAQPAQPVKAPPPQQIPTSRTTTSPPVNAAKKLQPAQPVARPQPVTSPTPARGLAKLPAVVQQRAQQAIQQARPIQQQLPPAMTPPQSRPQPVTPPPLPVSQPPMAPGIDPVTGRASQEVLKQLLGQPGPMRDKLSQPQQPGLIGGPPGNRNYSVEIGGVPSYQGPTNPLTGQLMSPQDYEKLTGTPYQPPNDGFSNQPDASVRDFGAFYQSPEFQNYQQQQTQMGLGTMDMYNSPYFGMQGSGSIGRAQDAAYEQYLRRTGQTNVLSQPSQLGYQGQPALDVLPPGSNFGSMFAPPMPGVTQPATQAQITSISTQPRIF